MRPSLATDRLRRVYDRAAGHYDFQHGFLTAGSDARGRRLVVERSVSSDDRVLDCGAGTGSTALLAARRAGPRGRITLFDLSEGMLEVARRRAGNAGLESRMDFRSGDMESLPFEDASFDVVLSTYSLCPLYDPERAAAELYRVTRPGGRLGIAHSTEPEGSFTRWLAARVEGVAWKIPALSLGCRAVSVLPALERAGVRVLFRRRLGVPLWPFLVLVLEKTRR